MTLSKGVLLPSRKLRHHPATALFLKEPRVALGCTREEAVFDQTPYVILQKILGKLVCGGEAEDGAVFK